MNVSRRRIAKALALIFKGIDQLKTRFPQRAFTIDGRLVGDIGEIVAYLEYDVRLDEVQRPVHDARTAAGRNVQIKATFKNHLTCRSVPDFYLGLKLYADGSYDEVYNGPGKHIAKRYKHRKGFGKDLLSFPISTLAELNTEIKNNSRIKRRSRPRVSPTKRKHRDG